MQFESHGRIRLFVVLCFAVVLAAFPGAVEAKKSEKKQQKKAAKQHSNVHELEKRDISHEQLLAMLDDYAQVVAAERKEIAPVDLPRVAWRHVQGVVDSGHPFLRSPRTDQGHAKEGGRLRVVGIELDGLLQGGQAAFRMLQ